MVWPASGTVTARFGEWRGSHRHAGIDIGMLRTLRLRSVLAGTVEKTGYASGYEGYGKVVILDLPGPYTALYAHLQKLSLRFHHQQQTGDLLYRVMADTFSAQGLVMNGLLPLGTAATTLCNRLAVSRGKLA